jgi:hypothetical protein
VKPQFAQLLHILRVLALMAWPRGWLTLFVLESADIALIATYQFEINTFIRLLISSPSRPASVNNVYQPRSFPVR